MSDALSPPAIIDMHTHIWCDASAGRSPDADERVLLDMADRYAIEAMVVMPLFGGLCPMRRDIEAANRAVAAFARRDARVRPMAYVYPRLGKHALDELNRWMEAGFV